MDILVAFDGSEKAEAALTQALEIAAAFDGSVTAVHAVNPAMLDLGGTEPTSFADADRQLIVESLDEAERRGLRYLESAETTAEAIGTSIRTELLYGPPVSAITTYATEEGFDAVFVGHRGLTGRAGLLLGSVARGLVERAEVPVTVVR